MTDLDRLRRFVGLRTWRDEPVPDEETLTRWAACHPIPWAILSTEGEFERADHLVYLASLLFRVWTGDLERLAVSLPPGHGKSYLTSIAFPSWWLGTRPQDRISVAAYGKSLAADFTRDSRDRFVYHASRVWPGLSARANACETNWRPYRGGKTQRGFMFGVGKGGPLTGKRAELLVVDDLFKDEAEASSLALRNHAWQWFNSAAMTRMAGAPRPGRAVVLMTRWHHDDVIGRLERDQREGKTDKPWTFLNLPAVAEGNDPLGREPGEALWPERYPLEELEGFKRRDAHVWSALYQGHPTQSEGSHFRRSWLKFYEIEKNDLVLPDGRRIARDRLERFGTCDLATSEKESADYTAIFSWGIDLESKLLFLLDVDRRRVAGPDIVPALQRSIERNNLAAVYVEKIGFQLNLIQHALRAGLPVLPIRPDKSKLARSLPAQAALEGGRVLFRARAHWIPSLEDELLSFPKGVHDDQVDAMSYGVIVFRKVLQDLYEQERASQRSVVAGSLLG